MFCCLPGLSVILCRNVCGRGVVSALGEVTWKFFESFDVTGEACLAEHAI